MDDLHLIDCVEKIRAHCLRQEPELSARLDRLRAADFRCQTNTHFKMRLVAVALGIDETTPAGRRLLRRELASGELAAHFSREEVSDSVAEDMVPGPGTSAASSRLRARLARSLAAFQTPAPAGEVSDPIQVPDPGASSSFARRLAREPGLPAAAALVAREMPVLRGLRVYEYLIECGYPAAVPSAESMRFLYRLGLLPTLPGRDSETAVQRGFFSTVERLARLTGSAMGELDLLIALFSGGRRRRPVEPVCTTTPRCEICALSPCCAFFRYRPPSAPLPESRPIRQWSAEERPRERLLAGERLTNAELLAIILRTGSGRRSAVDLARELLARFGTLHRLASAGLDEISRVHGIGPAKAAEIRAALELGRRVMQPESDERDGLRTVASSRDVFETYRPRYKNATQEEFLLLTLNTKNRITREVVISLGTLNSSIVHPRDVFNHALREAAAGVIFVHNHPSGDPAPSREDITLTARLCEGGRLLGIKVLDHVIIGATRYYSFADEGELR